MLHYRRTARKPDEFFFRNKRNLRRYLFPEIYGYDTKPEAGYSKTAAEGVRWNTDYTKTHFAEPLRNLRDSGTILRDYKESANLWFLASVWNGFWDQSAIFVVIE